MVTNLNDSGAGSLRADIQAANSGDTIQFANSLAGGTLQLTSGQLDLTKNLTIDGAGAGVTINAGGHSRVFEVESGVTANLNFLTIADGNAGGGGGIFNFGNLNVDYSTFTGNYASIAGGAIDNVGTLTINGCSFLSNTSGWGGAINNASGSASLTTAPLATTTASILMALLAAPSPTTSAPAWRSRTAPWPTTRATASTTSATR